MKSFTISLLFLLVFRFSSFTQQLPFSPSNISLPQLAYSASAWGDFDHDGDLDLALTGAEGNNPVTKILRNDNGTFTEAATGFDLHYGSVEWGDINHDGDLDLLATGIDMTGVPYTWVMLNVGGSFAFFGVPFPGVMDGQATFGDVNNDGSLDVLLAGSSMVRIYQNDGTGIFDSIHAGLPNLEAAVCSWVDYNNDGQSDVFISGNTGGGIISKLYQNNHGVFTEVTITPEPFAGLYGGQAKWADLDNDGDQDLVIAGTDLYVDGHFIFYRNDGNGQFTKFEYPEASLLNPFFDLADYNADGLIDVALIGTIPGCGGPPATLLLKNTGSFVFNTVSTLIPGYKLGAVSWGDYNNDGYSDLLLTGMDAFDVPKTTLYLNNLGDTSYVSSNTPPTTPGSLTVTLQSDKAILHWGSAGDSRTPKNGLSYNIRIGTQPDNSDILSPLASVSDGSRLVAAMGNTTTDTSYFLTGIPNGTYYFSVQAIDNGFRAGTFASPCMFSYSTVGIQNAGKDLGISFSPNPCHDYVTIRQSSSADVNSRIKIIYESGQCFYEGIVPDDLDISKWPKGLYLVQNLNSKELTSARFIKN